MRIVITQAMILQFALRKIQIRFQAEKKLEIKFGLFHLVNNYYRVDLESSFIEVNPESLIYFDPEDKECFYWGSYPGDYFYGLIHFKAIKNFTTALDQRLMQNFENVYFEKKPISFIYSEEIEKQLFTNKLV